MRSLKRSFAVAAIIGSSAAFADVFVIAHPSVQITASEIREIFVGDKQFAGSVKLIPVDNAGAQDQFLSKVLRMDNAKYNSTWTKKSFRDGLNPPVVRSGDAEVSEYVRKTQGAIGYVGIAPSGVNILQKY